MILYSYDYIETWGAIMDDKKYVWRMLILDTSGVYTQIYDEIYGNNPQVLQELYDKYSKVHGLMCLILEG